MSGHTALGVEDPYRNFLPIRKGLDFDLTASDLIYFFSRHNSLMLQKHVFKQKGKECIYEVDLPVEQTNIDLMRKA